MTAQPPSTPRRFSVRAALALSAVCATAVLAPFAVAGAREPAPTGTVLAGSGTPVADSYIVVFKDRTAAPATVTDRARTLADRYSGSVRFVYTAAVRGFAVRMSAARAARLAADPLVAAVEQDSVVRTAETQTPAPWGLDRTDQRQGPPDGSYTYATTAGSVHAYVIDTGIRTTHVEFGGRATVGIDTLRDGRNGQDCDGHGTHVAGTVGGSTYGMAKGVSLVAVRVLGCDGTGFTSTVLAGVSWVTAHAAKPAVATMSLGGRPSATLDAAVSASIASGVTYAVAAGNDSGDACLASPARVAAAITVGSVDVTDTRARTSNYGTCLDVFAPGVSIRSAYAGSDTDTAELSGTSMATPHVAGAAALYLAGHPGAAPAEVRNALVGRATPGVVADARAGSPNLLLYTGDQPPTTPPTTAPATTTPATTTPATTTPPRTTTPSAATTTPPRGFPTRPGTTTPPRTTPPTTAAPTTTPPRTTPPRGFPPRPADGAAVPTAAGRTNTTRLPIPDRGTVASAVTLAPRTGSALADLRVSVTIRHSYRGDLVLDLVGPDGTVHRLKSASFLDPGTDLQATYRVRIPAAEVGGVWTLRVGDAYLDDTGVLEGWGITG